MIKLLEALFSFPAKMLDSFILLFKKSRSPEFSIGAKLNIQDSRDIHIFTVQSSVPIPLGYKTDLSKFDWLNQKALGTCVWQTRRIVRQYLWWIRTGEIKSFSARSGHILTKATDGLPEGVQGTMPRFADSVLFNVGIAEDSVVPDDNDFSYSDYLGYPITFKVKENMNKYKIGGYVSVPADLNAVKQAIFQNGLVTFTLGIDTNWFVGIIQRVLNIFGYHNLIGYGYDVPGIYGRNSWSKSWIAQLAQAMGFPSGDFYIKWSDYQYNIYDIVSYVDIPKPILDNAKSLNYYFKNQLKYGQTSPEVLQLQNRLHKEGIWPLNVSKTGHYGVTTASCVLAYQIQNKVSDIGELNRLQGNYVGPATLRILNGEVGLDLLQAQIKIESQGNDYAIGDKNLVDHAYGCLQIRQGVMDTYNKTKGLSLKSQACLGNRELSIDVWKTYWTVYTDMITDKDKAFAWNGGSGWRARYRKPGWEKYTANLDAYWEKIKPMLV